jgi:hypothetical protein
MIRVFKCLLHAGVFAAGIAALTHIDFFSWELPQGLLMPLLGMGFLVYLVAFVATGGYRSFVRASKPSE